VSGAAALEGLARTGFVVKGALYLVVGALALQLALREGGAVTDKRGALLTVLGEPYGHALLLIAACGLFGYAAWRLLQGLVDPGRTNRGWYGAWMRVTYVVRGLLHGALGWQALRLYRGLGTSTGGGERAAAAELFTWPGGDWLVVAAGLGLIAFAIHELHGAWTGRLERDFDERQLAHEAGPWAVHVSRFGVAARGVVFILVGWSAVMAGFSENPSEVHTTETSLRTLASQPGHWGRALLGTTAAGFVAYGFYQMIHARYLHIRIPRVV
jgi:uncharacterized protein DUF1206